MPDNVVEQAGRIPISPAWRASYPLVGNALELINESPDYKHQVLQMLCDKLLEGNPHGEGPENMIPQMTSCEVIDQNDDFVCIASRGPNLKFKVILEKNEENNSWNFVAIKIKEMQ
jgi:hypothetical protein